MSEAVAASLRRSRSELGAARLLLSSGFSNEAISSAYTPPSMPRGLRMMGAEAKGHVGTIRIFGSRVVLESGFDRMVAAVLGELFGQRSEADYETSDISFAEAARAVADAQRFVDAVEEWIAGRG